MRGSRAFSRFGTLRHSSVRIPSFFRHSSVILPSFFRHSSVILPSAFRQPSVSLPSSFHHPSIIQPSSKFTLNKGIPNVCCPRCSSLLHWMCYMAHGLALGWVPIGRGGLPHRLRSTNLERQKKYLFRYEGKERDSFSIYKGGCLSLSLYIYGCSELLWLHLILHITYSKTVCFAAPLFQVTTVLLAFFLLECRDNGLSKVACSYSQPDMVT